MDKVAALPAREQTERAILKTILYSDLFEYPLTSAEIAHYLVEAPGSRLQVQAILRAPVWLDGRINQVGGYVMLPGREGIVCCRGKRARASAGYGGRLASMLASWAIFLL